MNEDAATDAVNSANNYENRARKQLLVVFSWMTIAVFLVFGISYFYVPIYWLGTVETSLAAVLAVNLFVFHRHPEKLDRASRVLVVIVYFMTYVIFLNGGLGNTGYLWIIFIPFFSMLLLEENDSKQWLGAYILGLGIILVLAYAGMITLKYERVEIRQTLIVFVTMLVLNYYNEKIRRITSHAIETKNRKLEALSKTDTLTGVANRLYLNAFLDQEFSRAKRYGQPLSLIMTDLDAFKKINDGFGHMVGDEVLKEAAAVLKAHIRTTDFLGRWGGEEFMVICPGIGKEQAKLLAEKLRKTIAETAFANGLNITASFGVSEFNSDDTLDDCIQSADDLLYLAKESGRNRVICA
jgi:diguanylate cyclase (GGDEF)-like protein